ncbi:hypothetical protein ACCAA_130196 [Candidatus Accumulibacter aalborgensis]|uniref:Uncharacterized protein n=1 Tax=Candidatus Accumulibacter aalborgensis TaxID=1860102 RepID=A0A1A8XK20_9PROT|nr:hypothetical protein ACCAA_130196 [Candidatus Accumulibacter aalborgensis]
MPCLGRDGASTPQLTMTAVAEPPVPPVRFPLAEGVGIFIGIVAWDVLTLGEFDLLKASLIGASSALAWYGVRTFRRRASRIGTSRPTPGPTDRPDREP